MQEQLKPDLGGLFRGSFYGRGEGGWNYPLSKTRYGYVKTWNLVRKYTHIFSFRKYTF